MRHELHLTSRGLRALGAAVLPMTLFGALVGGRAGAASVLCAAGIAAANQLVSALSTGWARTLTPNVLAVGYSVFVVRMFAVFAAFAVFAQMPWVHRALFAGAFCASLAVTLTAECLSYVRRSYVPRWRMIP